MLSLLIDAEEKRDVATVDVVGAYLLADMKYKVIVKMTGDAVDIMCKVNTNYIPFISSEKERKIIYVRFKKALYGCMQSEILWYSTCKDCLTDLRFK